MTSANNFPALFGLARPKLPFNFNILFKSVAQHGIDGGLIGAILLYIKFVKFSTLTLGNMRSRRAFKAKVKVLEIEEI